MIGRENGCCQNGSISGSDEVRGNVGGLNYLFAATREYVVQQSNNFQPNTNVVMSYRSPIVETTLCEKGMPHALRIDAHEEMTRYHFP